MTDLSPTALVAAIPTIGNEWLRGQRWFSSKSRTVAAVTVADWGLLPAEGAAAAEHEPCVLALARLRYSSGPDDLYQLPLIASRDPAPPGVRSAAATSVEADGVTWYLFDAFQFASFRRRLLELLATGATVPLQRGQVVFQPESALGAALAQAGPIDALADKLVTAEQSNSSIIYGETAILKGFRRVSAGVNPDVEVSRFLTTRADFRATPAMFGSIEYRSAENVAHSLGLMQSFAPNRGDAWEHTLGQLTQFLRRVPRDVELGEAAMARETLALASAQLIEISQLGRLTGQLHLALASDTHDPDFAPRPLTAEQIATWQATIRREGATTLRVLEQRLPELPAEQQTAVVALLDAQPRIEARIATLAELADAGLVMTRYHGDYHLGQVLVGEAGWLILDFEGEPLRTLAERRAHSSPLKDVAGMLRSLSYATQMGLRTVAAETEDDAAQLVRWAASWEQEARTALLETYGTVTEGAAFVPPQPLLDTALAVFELEKALYELNYELNNRPDWLLTPLRGILRAL